MIHHILLDVKEFAIRGIDLVPAELVNMDINRWIRSNCRFAAPLGDPLVPQTMPQMTTRHPADSTPMPNSEEQLLEEMAVPSPEVFRKMAEDIGAISELISFVGRPGFPSFTQAYKKTLGKTPPGSSMRFLANLEQFLQMMAAEKRVK